MQIETVIVGEFQVNCFIVWGPTREALVIDPGHEADRIAAMLDRHGLRVAAYLLTHGHMDHVSALAELHARHPAPISMHAADARWAFGPDNAMLPFYDVPRNPGRIDRLIEDGQSQQDGGLTYGVLGTPGHTPGSVCFLFEEGRALFTGDTLFAGSVGRTDLPGGNPRTQQASLRALAQLPDDLLIHAGHGPVTDMLTEKRTNYFLQRLSTPVERTAAPRSQRP